MQLGFVGLGRMGGNMVERLLGGGHDLVVTNRSMGPVDEAVKKGAVGAVDIKDLVGKLKAPRVVWLMIPAGDAVEKAIESLTTLLAPGDIIVDGGNSNFRDSIRRGEALTKKGF